MELDSYKIRNVLFWIIVIILILMFAWLVFGSSPTLEQISFVIAILFLFLAWEERINAKILGSKINNLGQKLNKLDKLDEIHKILGEINKSIRARRTVK